MARYLISFPSTARVVADGEWKVANFMWTVEQEGCPSAPGD